MFAMFEKKSNKSDKKRFFSVPYMLLKGSNIIGGGSFSTYYYNEHPQKTWIETNMRRLFNLDQDVKVIILGINEFKNEEDFNNWVTK